MPKVSVVIPVYNVEKYLRQCLDSVVCQTFQDIDIICVDDGSTDASGSILDEYAARDSRIRAIHKENTGYGNSMNVGLSYAIGEYIAIIESDDFVEPDMVEKLYNAAISGKADIAKAEHYDFIGGKDIHLDWLKAFPKRSVINSRECPMLLSKPNTIWTCLYRKEFLDKHGIRFHETQGASYQDISFAMQCWLWADRVYMIEDAVLHYRRDNPDSSMHNPNKVFCVIDEYHWLEEMFENFWKDNPVLEQYFVMIKYEDYLNHYYRVAVEYQYALLLRIENELRVDMQKGRLQKEIFDEQLWDKLNMIYENVNEFFQKTAKGSKDFRLTLCDIKNDVIYEEAFLQRMSTFDGVIIYGAGIVGKKLARLLMSRCIKINCFAVTKKDSEKSECMGVPIMELSSLIDQADNYAVIIAVTERKQYEMYCLLNKYGFKNIFRVDEKIRNSMKRNQLDDTVDDQ